MKSHFASVLTSALSSACTKRWVESIMKSIMMNSGTGLVSVLKSVRMTSAFMQSGAYVVCVVANLMHWCTVRYDAGLCVVHWAVCIMHCALVPCAVH